MTDTTSPATVQPLTARTFDEEVGAATVPYLAEFWATWCGPCGPYKEVVAQYAAEQAGAVRVGTVDSDAEPDLARRFGVLSVPTVLLLVHGEVVERLVGARGIARLREDLASHLT